MLLLQAMYNQFWASEIVKTTNNLVINQNYFVVQMVLVQVLRQLEVVGVVTVDWRWYLVAKVVVDVVDIAATVEFVGLLAFAVPL